MTMLHLNNEQIKDTLPKIKKYKKYSQSKFNGHLVWIRTICQIARSYYLLYARENHNTSIFNQPKYFLSPFTKANIEDPRRAEKQPAATSA